MEKLKYIQVQKDNKEHLQLFTELLTEYLSEIAPEIVKHATEWAREIISEQKPQGEHCEIVYLHQENCEDAIVGFMWGHIDSKGRGFLREFYIKPDYRLNGYGSELFYRMEKFFIADGAKDIWLTADDGVKRFWESVGLIKTDDILPGNNMPIYIKAILSIKKLSQDAADEKSRICRAILAALPDWFGIPEAIDNYEKSVRSQSFWAAYDGEKAIGFIAIAEHNSYTDEIDVMGILPDYQHKGLGRRLVDSTEKYCRGRGKSMMLVKTIDFAHPDIYYARTRAFYLAMGFVPLQVLSGYWDESNPCLLFGKCLNHGLRISTLPVGNKKSDFFGIIQWAEEWDWGVGKIVAKRLTNNNFSDWEMVIAATVGEQYAGLCILEKKDDYGTDLDPALTPFITAVYVDPKFRGQRVSEKMLGTASNFARSLGFDAVYLISNEQGFYEKYGFEKFAETVVSSGRTEPVYKRKLI